MGGLRQSGWYPDPNDNTAEVYWDGNRLHGRRNKLVSPQQTGQVTGKKSSTARVWVTITGLIVCAVIIIGVVWACSTAPSPYEKECRKDGLLHGLQGEQLEDMVRVCVDLKNEGYK
jgi:hypothetical protein